MDQRLTYTQSLREGWQETVLTYAVSDIPDLVTQHYGRRPRMFRPDRVRVTFFSDGDVVMNVSGPWVLANGLGQNRASNRYEISRDEELPTGLEWVLNNARRDLEAGAWMKQEEEA